MKFLRSKFSLPGEIFSPTAVSADRHRKLRILLKFAACFAGGGLYAASLPPFNLTPAAAVCLVPLLFVLHRANWKTATAAGWVWGLGWSLFSFRFLREIDPLVPWLMAPVISLWPAVFAGLIPFLRNHSLRTNGKVPAEKQSTSAVLLLSAGTAAWFVITEWTRSRLFPWNDFSVPFWRVPVMLQTAVFTGHYGINFLTALANTAVAALLIYRSRKVFCILSAVILASAGYGAARLYCRKAPEKTIKFRPALIQGNLSQRRKATLAQAQEALDVYISASREVLTKSPAPDVIIWPEGAVPIPFYSAYNLSDYRQVTDYGRLASSYQTRVKHLCRSSAVPMLIGALDLADSIDGKNPGSTNSALLFDTNGTLRTKYDKLHRVPFGEYIPFRKLLPDFLIRYIDMGRDLVPGRNANPVVLSEKLRAGTAICYEGIFSYVMRNFAARGANFFIVLSNDAWYPRSSEPEQHLANAVLRAVETGLMMIRCGNNGGSGIVFPDGTFKIIDPTGKSPRPELLRCKAAETIELDIPEEPEKTFYVKYGEWFITLLILLFTGWCICAFRNFIRQEEKLFTANDGSTNNAAGK